jgi:hypothetical protein
MMWTHHPPIVSNGGFSFYLIFFITYLCYKFFWTEKSRVLVFSAWAVILERVCEVVQNVTAGFWRCSSMDVVQSCVGSVRTYVVVPTLKHDVFHDHLSQLNPVAGLKVGERFLSFLVGLDFTNHQHHAQQSIANFANAEGSYINYTRFGNEFSI